MTAPATWAYFGGTKHRKPPGARTSGKVHVRRFLVGMWDVWCPYHSSVGMLNTSAGWGVALHLAEQHAKLCPPLRADRVRALETGTVLTYSGQEREAFEDLPLAWVKTVSGSWVRYKLGQSAVTQSYFDRNEIFPHEDRLVRALADLCIWRGPEWMPA